LTVSSSQITIFGGRFGCGKTEIALNYALEQAKKGNAPFLIDLDIVTPYFRTRDRAKQMAEQGVEIVSPFEVGQYIHIPAIDPRILGAIEQAERPVILDVGGDEQGARALSQYADTIKQKGYEMHFVVNPYRPFMDSATGVREAVREIETSSRLRASTLVSNPNLMSETSPELFNKGHKQVLQAADALGLQVSMAVMSKSLLKKMVQPSLNVPILVIHRFFLMFDVEEQ